MVDHVNDKDLSEFILAGTHHCCSVPFQAPPDDLTGIKCADIHKSYARPQDCRFYEECKFPNKITRFSFLCLHLVSPARSGFYGGFPNLGGLKSPCPPSCRLTPHRLKFVIYKLTRFTRGFVPRRIHQCASLPTGDDSPCHPAPL